MTCKCVAARHTIALVDVANVLPRRRLLVPQHEQIRKASSGSTDSAISELWRAVFRANTEIAGLVEQREMLLRAIGELRGRRRPPRRKVHNA